MGKILIIARDQFERAYIGAQLIEDGLEVEGSSSIIEAIRQVRESKSKPDLVIIDSRDQRLDKEIVTVLNKLISEAPLLLIHGTWDSAETLDWEAGIQELSRPITIGQIVDKAKEIIDSDKSKLKY